MIRLNNTECIKVKNFFKNFSNKGIYVFYTFLCGELATAKRAHTSPYKNASFGGIFKFKVDKRNF